MREKWREKIKTALKPKPTPAVRHIPERGGGQREPSAVVQGREPAAGLQLRREVLHGEALVGGPSIRTQVSEGTVRNRYNASWVWKLSCPVSVIHMYRAQSQGLLESLCVSSSINFLLAWLHSNCNMAHRPGELPQKLSSKPCDALCSHNIR